MRSRLTSARVRRVERRRGGFDLVLWARGSFVWGLGLGFSEAGGFFLEVFFFFGGVLSGDGLGGVGGGCWSRVSAARSRGRARKALLSELLLSSSVSRLGGV